MPASEITDLDAFLTTCQVPAIPKNLKAILDAASDPSMTSGRLEKIVLADAALTTQLLKLVNSAFYAMQSKITSIHQAVVLLGFPSVKSIASGLLMTETFSRMEKLDKDYMTSVWRNSLIASGLIPIAAANSSLKDRDELVLAALLHHVGHLVLANKFGAEYRALTQESPFPASAAEKEKFGIDHASIGGKLLEKWNIPPRIVVLVRYHHEPKEDPADASKIKLLRACDAIAEQSASLPFLLDTKEYDLLPGLREVLQDAKLSWEELRSRKDAILGAIKGIDDAV